MEKRKFGTLKILDPLNVRQSKETPLEAGEARGETTSQLHYHQKI
jgi:hypothetical protein